jgi:hypothetical protein
MPRQDYRNELRSPHQGTPEPQAFSLAPLAPPNGMLGTYKESPLVTPSSKGGLSPSDRVGEPRGHPHILSRVQVFLCVSL